MCIFFEMPFMFASERDPAGQHAQVQKTRGRPRRKGIGKEHVYRKQAKRHSQTVDAAPTRVLRARAGPQANPEVTRVALEVKPTTNNLVVQPADEPTEVRL